MKSLVAKGRGTLAVVALMAAVALAGCQSMPDAGTPSVTVGDQAVKDGSVTVATVVSKGPGWIVIHAQKDGKPGPVIGYAPVKDGVNRNVMAKVDASKATDVLYAMLHTDAGVVATYEFPGADVPVKAGDQVITPPFKMTKTAM